MKIKDLTYLVALSPLAFLPFLSDPTPSGRRGAEAQSDTTYLSTGYSAYLVPIYADTVVQYPDTFILGGPDQDSVPVGTPGRWYPGPGDSTIFLSYRIGEIPATEKDSTFIDSVWADWGLGVPYAYNAAVPGTPSIGADPTFTWNFSEITDTEALWLWEDTNSYSINLMADNEDHWTTIDLTDGYGESDRSYMMTFKGWPAIDTLHRCIESTTGFEIPRTTWDDIVGYTNDEFYWELAIKWDTHWTPLPDICALNPDHKIFRLIYINLDYGTVSSASLKAGNFASMLFVPNAPNQYDGSSNEPAANGRSIIPWIDGQWHTIRFGGKRSSAKGVKDGHWWASIDSGGTRIPLLPGTSYWGDTMDIWWDTLATWQTAPYFGRNRHIMPEIDDQSYYFGQLDIYAESPQWPEFPGGPDFEGQ